jgi:hypothetical protein
LPRILVSTLKPTNWCEISLDSISGEFQVGETWEDPYRQEYIARIWWPRYCHKRSCLYVARKWAWWCPPHDSDGGECKSPPTFRVMTKGHFGHCTWGKRGCSASFPAPKEGVTKI